MKNIFIGFFIQGTLAKVYINAIVNLHSLSGFILFPFDVPIHRLAAVIGILNAGSSGFAEIETKNED